MALLRRLDQLYGNGTPAYREAAFVGAREASVATGQLAHAATVSVNPI